MDLLKIVTTFDFLNKSRDFSLFWKRVERIEGVRDREGISSFPRYFSTYAQLWLAFLVREYVNVDTLDSLSVPKVTDRFSFNQESTHSISTKNE